MVNTKKGGLKGERVRPQPIRPQKTSLLKTAIASGTSCWRLPRGLKNSRGNIRIRSLANGKRVRRPERAPGPGHFFLILRREQASEQGGWARSARAGERASLRAVREQTSVDVSPVIHGQWRNFADVSEQAEDR